MAFKSIKRANIRINELLAEINEVKLTIIRNENNVSAQDFANMRLRAQKAELALEANIQANIDRGITDNTKRHNLLKNIEALIQKY